MVQIRCTMKQRGIAMNQIIRPEDVFRSAKPAGPGAVPRIGIEMPPARPGVFSRLAERLRRWLAMRRTLRALDELSEAQLKDIGYRRIPNDPSSARYERLP
jgi:uncharacterized protein YjiS (DUF1127 family)